jgi:hypothetical protein
MPDYATRRVETWIGDDCTIVDDMLRADKAMAVAREEWEYRKLVGPGVDKVVVRNERTGAVCDTISHN